MRKPSAVERGSVLVAAVSARGLAAAVRRAGLVPLTVDFFADADTKSLAHAWHKLKDLSTGFVWDRLGPALEALSERAPSPVLGLVCGSGFEDRPELLERLARRWPLLGNDSATVARVKAPEVFFAMLDKLGIPHPATRLTACGAGRHWLAKRRGGAGGSHVARRGRRHRGGYCYYQEPVQGRSISAAFLANGVDALVLGFSEQWQAPSRRSKWRYGGAVTPARLDDKAAEAMSAAVQAASRAFRLRGLCSADFIVGERGPLLLEINPRPGATLDIFDRGTEPLLLLHLRAASGALPIKAPALKGAAASAIVFASTPVSVPRHIAWPDWVADRPHGGECIDKDRPICTVTAEAGTAEAARRLVEERRDRIARMFVTAHAA